jgi:hypothetical protein
VACRKMEVTHSCYAAAPSRASPQPALVSQLGPVRPHSAVSASSYPPNKNRQSPARTIDSHSTVMTADAITRTEINDRVTATTNWRRSQA